MSDNVEPEDSEFERLMLEIEQYPRSLRKNAPLNNHTEKQPKWFKEDTTYVVQNDIKLVPLDGTKSFERKKLKSPTRGGIRLCRIREIPTGSQIKSKMESAI